MLIRREDAMKTTYLALILAFTLSACATVCPPAPANTMSDSPFRNYRLSALVINTTDYPARPFAEEILDTELATIYRPADYLAAEQIIRDSFSKPSEAAYQTAPALHMLCSMETVANSQRGAFNLLPAKIVGKISIVDPGTKRTLIFKQCDFEASTMPNAKTEECKQKGLSGLSDVINQCLRQFTPGMQSISVTPQPTQGALLDGTFVGVTGNFTPNPPSLLQKITNSLAKQKLDIRFYRIVTYELPTALSKAFVDNSPFSNAATNTYSIKIDVSDSDITDEFFSRPKMRYTAVNTILKNGKPVGSFTYASSQTLPSERSTLYLGHMQAIIDYLRDHAAEIDKK